MRPARDEIAQQGRGSAPACVTSSAVVGSSAMSSLRLERQAMRDHDALPLAARELVRIARRRERGEAAARRGRASLAPVSSRIALRRRVCQHNASATCAPMVFSGFSAVIGSWNTMPMSCAAQRAHLRLGQRRAGRCRRSGWRRRPPRRAAAAASRTAPSSTCRSRTRRPAPSPRRAAIDEIDPVRIGVSPIDERQSSSIVEQAHLALPPQVGDRAGRAGRRRAG